MTTRAKETTLRFYKERLLRVLVEIQQRLDEPLRLEELASLACLSPHHFHHVFTGMLGESLKAHIRRLRLERAACRLKLSQMQVVQVALEAGYETHEAFTRAFRDSFGCSPTQFRNRHRASLELRAASGVHYHNAAQLRACLKNRSSGRKSARTSRKTDRKLSRLTSAATEHGILKHALRDLRAVRCNDKAMNVTIKHLKPMRVAFMRHVGPYHEVGKTWEKLMIFLGKEGLLGGDVQFLGICHDDPAVTSPDKIRYDACLTVDDGYRAEGEIGVQTIPGGEYAMMTHVGPYEKLGESYAKLLGQWLPRSGQNLRSTPCFEVYLNSPESTEPEDLITDLYAPLETK